MDDYSGDVAVNQSPLRLMAFAPANRGQVQRLTKSGCGFHHTEQYGSIFRRIAEDRANLNRRRAKINSAQPICHLLLNDRCSPLLRFLCMPDQWGRNVCLLILCSTENTFFKITLVNVPPAVGTIRVGKATVFVALSSLRNKPSLPAGRFVLER